MDMMQMWDTVLALLQSKGVLTVFILSLVNILVGSSVALQAGTFKLYELDDQFYKLVPYIVAYFSVLLMQSPAMEVAVFSAIVAAQSSQILKNIALLFPEIAATLPNITLSPISEMNKIVPRDK